MNLRHILIGSALAATLITAPGCAALVVGAAAGGTAYGVVKYSRGELVTTHAVSLDQAVEATRAGLKSLDLPEVTSTASDNGMVIVSRDKQDDKISIQLQKISDTATEIRIRVGVFGDEAESQMVNNAIASHLPSKK